MIPHLTLYVDLPFRKFAAAMSMGPVVLIRPQYRGEAHLLAHELEHVRQWYVTLGLHSLLYLLSRRYRFWSEARAYARSVQEGVPLERVSKMLADPYYKLNVTRDEAKAAIMGQLEEMK